ncbi:MAG TPA: translation elongation factor Ts [Gaiellaceae bacterium]|nr:translation elongation factor Ts [Gaiellaceae bacterium]
MSATISASQVKELRAQTGAGMMDVKNALVETNGDMDAAKRLLREKGMAQAGKRADRTTSEGIVLVTVSGGVGAIAAVGCETEPVSKNDEFIRLAEQALESIEGEGPEALAKLEPARVEAVAKLGENISLRGARLEAQAGELIADYVHPPANKIGVLVKLKGGGPVLARQLAMHISWSAPAWVRREDVPAEVVASERDIYASTDEVASKPEQAREKIVEGMLNKRFFAASPGGVLVDQPWIHDPAKTVQQALQEAGAEVLAFERFQLG